MKILYFSRSYSPHDFRFLSAIIENKNKAFFLSLAKGSSSEKRPLPKGVQQVSGSLQTVIAKVKPELIHAGPLPDCAYQVAKSGFHPFIAMSWGSDILWDAVQHASTRKRIQFTLDKTDLVIGDCQSVKRAVEKNGVSNKRIIIFPWGVDLKKFQPKGKDGGMRSRLGWQRNFVILHLRAWEPLYDPMTVIRAFITAAYKNPELRLLMPGDGSLQGNIKRALSRADLQDRVHFPGRIPQKELPNYFHASDVYTSAALSDGSSVSLMEALACGIPALVSDISGNIEWVQPSKQGWLFPVKNEDKLTELMLRASSSKRLTEMGDRARKTAEHKADWNKNKKLLNLAYKIAMESR